VNHLASFAQPVANQWVSAAIPSDGNPYGVPDGLIFSFPLTVNADSSYRMVAGLDLNDYARGMLQRTVDELFEEREAIADLLK
jgi:malate/lactate dehydrogenase